LESTIGDNADKHNKGLEEHGKGVKALTEKHEGFADRLDFIEKARDQERREFDAEVQALKHRLQQVQDSNGEACSEVAEVTKLAEEVEALRRQVTEGEPAQKVEHLEATVRELQDIHEDLKKVEKASFGEAEIADLKQQVEGLKEVFEVTKQWQDKLNSQMEATQRKHLNVIRADMRVVQASQEASAKRQAQIEEGSQSLEKEQLQLASKLQDLEGGRTELGQDMQVVKEAILHMQQELRNEVVIVLKDLDAKNESRFEAVWTELQMLQHHVEAAQDSFCELFEQVSKLKQQAAVEVKQIHSFIERKEHEDAASRRVTSEVEAKVGELSSQVAALEKVKERVEEVHRILSADEETDMEINSSEEEEDEEGLEGRLNLAALQRLEKAG